MQLLRLLPVYLLSTNKYKVSSVPSFVSNFVVIKSTAIRTTTYYVITCSYVGTYVWAYA